MSIRAFRAIGAGFALVILGALAQAALLLPSTNGPGLGDVNVNPFTLAQAVNQMNQAATSGAIAASVANTQATCTAITNPLNRVTTSVSTGSVCLPTAFAGQMLWISNATANGLNLFGANAPFVAGTADTINGATGSTANTTVLPAAGAAATKQAFCFSPANGAWNCNIATGP